MVEQPAQESWNMATETLKRLSRILDMCSFYSQKGDLVPWFYASMDLRRNLAPFLDESTEFSEVDKKIKEFPVSAIRHGKIIRASYAKAHQILDELYLIFIRYMKAKGLLMPKTTDPRAAVMNM